jgi:alpha-L-fucosidase
VHGCGRDLVREFVDECNAQGVIPFFYHTLLDWHEESYQSDFKTYLQYLRDSVEILCKNYGKIGGFWFDGMWNKPNDDWEEDALYGTIRKYQPNAMIINNTGLSARGELGHIELDSVTFERGRPEPINMGDAPKYIASEMCQTMNDHWGYAKNDLSYKSLKSLIEDLCVCRRYGSNFLLNVGPMGNGLLRPLDKAMLEELGNWTAYNKEAVYLPRPTGIEITSKPQDFILEKDGTYYLFVHDLPMIGSPDVAMRFEHNPLREFKFDKKIKSVTALDDPSVVIEAEQKDGVVKITTPAFVYGN